MNDPRGNGPSPTSSPYGAAAPYGRYPGSGTGQGGHPWPPSSPHPTGYGLVDVPRGDSGSSPAYDSLPTILQRRMVPPLLLIGGLVVIALATMGLATSVPVEVRTTMSLTAIPNDGLVITLEAGTDYAIYDALRSTTCTVIGPDGAQVPVLIPTSVVELDDRRQIGIFTPSTDGQHTVTCSPHYVTSPAYVGLQTRGDTIVKTILSTFGLIGGLPSTRVGFFVLRMRTERMRTNASRRGCPRRTVEGGPGRPRR